MPQMGVSVAEGTIVEWKKAVGEAIERDEIICSISTDKIDTDVEAPASGTLAEILVEVGETVAVGTVLARIDAGGGGGANGDGGDPAPQNTESLSEADAALNAPGDAGELSGDTTTDHDGTTTRAAGVQRAKGGPRYSPVVMRIAAEHGIDLSTVKGTGRGGRVRKQDVLAVVEGGGGEPPMHIESPYQPDEPAAPRARKPRFAREEPAAAPAPAPAPFTGDLGPVQSAPLSRMRQSIGRAMIQSLQTAATCTTIVEVDLHRVEAERRRLGLTALPFVARATVDTLREFPALNATLEGETFSQYEHVHLGVAVSLGSGGLIVPVIHNAHELSVEGLSARIKDLARRARDNALTPDDVRGGTFTITNPGGYGSIMATPVINQPQVAILDTEAVVKRPVVLTDAGGNDSIAIRPMSYFCMSWDHRALDGALAAQFLFALKTRLESL
ncbi:MAG TPA: dihydrolipoamide acetyltransferase family protein [Solirubrobacteraceae bacterium]|nr:dihydrolipoamide acetyltransferase family protein [Solirubrobacteraceae bacterium]